MADTIKLSQRGGKKWTEKADKKATLDNRNRQARLDVIQKGRKFQAVAEWEVLWREKFRLWATRLERGEISAGRFKEEVGMDYLGALTRWYRAERSAMLSRTKGLYAAGWINKEEYRAIKEVLGGE